MIYVAPALPRTRVGGAQRACSTGTRRAPVYSHALLRPCPFRFRLGFGSAGGGGVPVTSNSLAISPSVAMAALTDRCCSGVSGAAIAWSTIRSNSPMPMPSGSMAMVRYSVSKCRNRRWSGSTSTSLIERFGFLVWSSLPRPVVWPTRIQLAAR